jgi:hypothetical protein
MWPPRWRQRAEHQVSTSSVDTAAIDGRLPNA